MLRSKYADPKTPTFVELDFFYQGQNYHIRRNPEYMRPKDRGEGMTLQRADAVLEFLVASGEILLVTTPEPTSITDSYSLLKALNGHPGLERDNTQICIIANRVSSANEGEVLFQKLDVVVSRYLKLPITYLGAVPQDPLLAKAVMQQLPVSLQNPQARSAQAYEEIAAKLMKQDEGQNTQKRGVAAFFSHIIGKRNNG